MSDPVEPLVLDLLESLVRGPRPYADVIDVWRTSCPRLPVWEEANARGYLACRHERGGAATVALSASGAAYVRAPRRAADRRVTSMASLDHVIVKVNDLAASVAFYTEVLGFATDGVDGPFTRIRVGADCQLQLAPWGTEGFEHYAFAVTPDEFERIVARIRARGIAHGPSFDTVGANTGPGAEDGARGSAPTLYFNDPNRHLLEIRAYAAPPVSPTTNVEESVA